MTYLIRSVGDGWEITKWEEWGGKRPDALYLVKLNAEEWMECDCPGNRRWGNCKHSLMVRMWIRGGKRVWFPIVLGLGPYGWGL